MGGQDTPEPPQPPETVADEQAARERCIDKLINEYAGSLSEAFPPDYLDELRR